MSSELDDLLTCLQQDKALKVWSLIITFFGDVVHARGGNVSARTIQQVLGAMGVGAGAVRTALHRLINDGWIERQKLGRESYYELSDQGRELSSKAASRIYADLSHPVNIGESHQWRMAIAAPGSRFSDVQNNEQQPHAVNIAANCRLYLTPIDSDPVDGDTLIVGGDLQQVPGWVADSLMPVSLRHGYQSIVTRFSTIKQLDQLSPINSLVLRCLLIHEWRRLLLRTPVVPSELHASDWPEHDCRQFVAGLYRQLLVRSESWLDEHATCIHGSLPGSLPVAINSIENRFTADFQSQ